MEAKAQLDPTSLVARIIAELQANPDALAVVAGYGIDPLDAKRADAASVRYLEVSLPRPN